MHLTEEQRMPVEDTEGAILVFAGAGSGKTRVLTERIAYIINKKNVPARKILAITFTNKAAEEMQERLSSLVLNNRDMWICTIHSMCTKMLRMFADRLGYGKNFTIYTTVDKDRVLKRIFEELGIDDENIKKNAGWHISEAKTTDMSSDEYQDLNLFNPKIKEIVRVFRRYEEELFRCNAMDFDDLLIKALHLLKQHEEAREYFQSRFEYVHIDEFQDTNKVQYAILRILVARHGNIFAVGDDDQSIYGWRGADINNILNFEKDFPNVKTYKLEQNFRSTKNILDAANKIIEKNSKRFHKTLFTNKEGGVRVENFAAFDEIQEANYVVGLIYSLVKERGLRYKDVAILMRINALSRYFEQEMRKYNIPYVVFGGFKFFERKEIKDLLAYLRVVDNPRDDEAVLRIVNVPKRGIGDTAVAYLRAESKAAGKSIFDTVIGIEDTALTNKMKAKFFGLRAILTELRALSKELTLDEFAKKMVEITAFKEQFDTKTEEDLNRLFNIEEFLASVKEFCEQNFDADLAQYLTSISLASDLDDANDDDYVSIATVHSAKGLEFNTVFIVGLDENIFPIVRNGDESDLEEERRLMYVAITRARERLYLTRAKSRFLYGERNHTIASRFLCDLFPQKKEIISETGKWIEVPLIPPTPKADRRAVDYDAFLPNKNVVHKVFGQGIIVSVRGEGEDKIAEVCFKGVGTKNLSLQFAPLVLVD